MLRPKPKGGDASRAKRRRKRNSAPEAKRPVSDRKQPQDREQDEKKIQPSPLEARALEILAPLCEDEQCQVFRPQLQALAKKRIAARIIIGGAKHTIDLEAFFGALPKGGEVPPTAENVAFALNKGLGITDSNLKLRHTSSNYSTIINNIANEMKQDTVRARKVLSPLCDNLRFANPAFQRALHALLANPDAVRIILQAKQDFNVSTFLRRLPERGGIPTEAELVIALNAGLGLGENQGFGAETHRELLAPLVDPNAWNNTIRVNRVLAPLYHDPRFKTFQPALRAFAQQSQAAEIIAQAPNNLNLNIFLAHFPKGATPSREQLVAALNAALGIQLNSNENAYKKELNAIVGRDVWTPVVTTAIRANNVLAPLYNNPDDRRFATLGAPLRALASHPDAARIIAAARHNINVHIFFERLPEGGVPPTPQDLVAALNAALGLDARAGLVHSGAYANELQVVCAAMNTDVIRAHKVLAPLRDIPRVSKEFKKALYALAKNSYAAAKIAEAKQDINIPVFLAHLNDLDFPPSMENFIAALNAGLGLADERALAEDQKADPPQAEVKGVEQPVLEVKNVDHVPAGIEDPAELDAELAAELKADPNEPVLRAMEDELPAFEAELKADPYQQVLGAMVDEKAMNAIFYAHKRLAPLYYDQRFANPRFQEALRYIIDQYKDSIASKKDIIAEDINVTTFLEGLPLGREPTPVEFSIALNNGLGLHDDPIQYDESALRSLVRAIKWSDHVASPHAQQKLTPLFNDPRFAGVQAFKDALVALSNQPHAATIIAAAPHRIDPAAFLRSLPEGGDVPNARELVTALNAGLDVRLTADGPYRTQLSDIREAMQDDVILANKILAPLYDDRRFNNPQLKMALRNLVLDPNTAGIIASSPQNFKVEEFLRALPVGGGVPNAAELVAALNVGLNIGPNTPRNGLVENNVPGPLLQAVLHQDAWDNKVRANKVLANLYDDPRFALLKARLFELANQDDAANLIAEAKQNINVNTFLEVISQVPPNRAPDARELASALNQSLGIAAAGLDHEDVAYRSRIANIARQVNDTIRAHQVLAPLYDDPRFVSLQPALRDLASHPRAAAAIVAAGSVLAAAGSRFAVGTFLYYLSPPGDPPTPGQLVNALNAALGGRPLAEGRGYNDKLRAICHASSWNDTVRATSLLAPLYYHPRCTALQATLLELLKQPRVAEIIANGHRFDMDVFVDHLSIPPIDGAAFAVALTRGLGLAENALLDRADAEAQGLNWQLFNNVAIADAPALVTLRALHVVQPLREKYQALNGPLRALAEHKATADEIAPATQVFNHDAFIRAMPEPGAWDLDPDALARAINMGFSETTRLQEHDGKLQAVINVINNDQDTINQLKAKRALLPLIEAYPALGPALTAVAEQKETAAQIATARQAFNLDIFVGIAWPAPGEALNPTRLAAALTEVLRPVQPIRVHEDVLANVLAVTDPINKLKARRALEPLMLAYPALVPSLTAIVKNKVTAAQIATARQEFMLDDFVGALPAPGVTLNANRLGAAISAGLGLQQPLREHGGVLLGVLAVQEPINELKAKRALLPLTAKYPIFAAIAENKDAAGELALAPHEFDLDRFVRGLPGPGPAWTAANLAQAINAGFQDSIALEDHDNVLHNILDPANQDTINQLKAKRALLPLIEAYPALGPALTAVAEQKETAAQIATAQRDFGLPAFVGELPAPPNALTPAALAAAITRALNLANPLTEHGAVLAGVLAVTEPVNKLKARRALTPLMEAYPAADFVQALTAIVNNEVTAAQIVTAQQDFKLSDFIGALPAPGVPWEPNSLAVAISRGLNLRPPLREREHLFAGVLNAANLGAADAPIHVLKAKRALLPLTAKYPMFAAIAENKAAAAELAAAQHEFDLDRFVRRLPEPQPGGRAWTPDELKDAINVGFQGARLQERDNVLQNILLNPANQETINQLKAKSALLPLIDECPALSDALTRVAEHKATADQIATATQPFDFNVFVGALPGPPTAWDSNALVEAMKRGFIGTTAGLVENDGRLQGVVNAINADVHTQNRLKALRALQPLIADPRFASLQTTLRALAANPGAAVHIAASRQEINIADFLKALPVEGRSPTAEQLAKALDAGLGINTLAPNRSFAGVGRGYNAALKSIVAGGVWNDTVRAHKFLAPLYYYPGFEDLQAPLFNLANTNLAIASLIARGHNINIADFFKALPRTGVAPTSEELAHALNVGLGLSAGTLNIAAHAVQLNPIRVAVTPSMRAAINLQPLLDDPRLESIRAILNTLITHPLTRLKIAVARQQINVDTFFARLPPGGALNNVQLVNALNASLGITNLDPNYDVVFDPIVAAWNGNNTVRANKVLAPLYKDLRFANPNFQAALNALTSDPVAAGIIAAAAHDIDIPVFLAALPTTEMVTVENLTAALNAGLGLLRPVAPAVPAPAAPPPPAPLDHNAGYGALINNVAGAITWNMLRTAIPVTVSDVKSSMHEAGVDLDDRKPEDRKKIYDIIAVNREAELKTPVYRGDFPNANDEIGANRKVYKNLVNYYVSESKTYKLAPKKEHVEWLDEHVYELKRHLKILEACATTHAHQRLVRNWLTKLEDAERNLLAAKALLTLPAQALQEQKTRGVYESWSALPAAEQQAIVNRADAKLGAGAALAGRYAGDRNSIVTSLMTAAEAREMKDAVFGGGGVGAAPLVLAAGDPYREREFKHDAGTPGPAGAAPADSSFVPVIVPVRAPARAAAPAPAIQNVKSVAIQTRNATSARSEIFIEKATAKVAPITRTVGSGFWKSEIKIPNMSVLECAARHVKNFLQIHPTPNNPVITIIRGDMPLALLEAICLYCKYKKINYEPSNVTKLSSDQCKLYAEKWQARHPEQRNVSDVKAEENVVGIPAPGQRG